MLIDRFNKYTIPIPFSGCLLWIGNGNRYGKLKVNKKYISAHRLAYILFRGTIPKDMFVLHMCDVEGCVNPNHLYLGTQKENQIDRYQRSKRFNRDKKTGRFVCGS